MKHFLILVICQLLAALVWDDNSYVRQIVALCICVLSLGWFAIEMFILAGKGE